MLENRKKIVLSAVMLLGLPLVSGPAVYAAKPVNLAHQNMSVLNSFVPARGVANNGASVVEISRSTDFNKTVHIRVQQTYAGAPVFGADAVVHVPNGKKNLSIVGLTGAENSMNGTFYQDLQTDLASTPASSLTNAQAQKALNHVVSGYQQKMGFASAVKDQNATLMVYIDKANKAHWAYQVTFYADPAKQGDLPTKPVVIVDATTFAVYSEWDNIQTIRDDATSDVFGGGFGGNKKMGKISYDSLSGDLHLEKFKITRTDSNKTCQMKNADVTIKSSRTNNVMSFDCNAVDADHNNIYWSADKDAVNEGYGPMNDAMLDGVVLKDMYQKWYNVPVLTENGKPMMLTMVVHAQMDNAYWDGKKMTFGDGISMFYPLTSLGVGAHEVSHGFTQQHSNLVYNGQSGGMNEAFSDMAAQAAETYAYKKNSWQIGPEIFKRANEALRYMDKPSKDCGGKQPGDWCSIDKADQYYDGLDVHFSSGIFNRAFYLMGSKEGWNDTKKAFDVMVKANMNYWTSNTSFVEGACGVLKAAKDYSYDLETVKKAFTTVGVDTSKC